MAQRKSSPARRNAVRRHPAKAGLKQSVAAAPQRPGVGAWIAGARPRTLPLAIAPVALGTGTAIAGSGAVLFDGPSHAYQHWTVAILCFVVAIALQIGVNFANDYSDGVRGTDVVRLGPQRLTASGVVRPRTVLLVALAWFVVAALAGIAIVVLTQTWWLLAIGAVAIAAAWFYTGGKRPYGYAGFGEIAVFLFFGIAATAGSTYAQIGVVTAESWLSAVAIGCIACAVLVVNNLRDIGQDAAVGKRTLSVLIGATGSRILYGVLMLVPFPTLLFFTFFYPGASLVFLTMLLAGPAVLIAVTARTARELVLALSLTGLFALTYGVGLALVFSVA